MDATSTSGGERAAPPSPPPDVAVLAAILHDAERIIDHQVGAIEELDDKSEHMIGLAAALLAGGLSLATIVVTTDDVDPHAGFFWLLLVGGVVNLVAFGAFLESYIGFRRGVEVQVGPGLEWLQDKANDPTWSLPSHYLSLLSSEGFPAYYEFNLAKMAHSAAARTFGLFTLSVAGILYASALVYLLAKAI